MEDAYLTLEAPATGEYKDRGSRFIAYAFPLENELDWQAHLETVKKQHPKARHHCYAYRIGLDENNYRANDDGEPSGTAGRPILGQIDSFSLTNVFIVVVRYFGGTLLGTSGLINAYKSSAQAAIESAAIVEKIIGSTFRLAFDYGIMGELMNTVKKQGIEILDQDFGASPTIDISIRRSAVEKTLLEMKASLLKVSLEEAATITNIPGLTISPLH
ncbi:MAG: YigZ family protein [Lewinellaceae bacterium]|nr:YigZ family protein [Saprospiraceae bacterium]MCB9340928.1 YigZ family protein [Lewinellaceae bacterium]